MSDIITDIIVESPLYQEIQLDARKEESHDFLMQLVNSRFGNVEEKISKTIKKLSKEQARDLGVKLLNVQTFEDFKVWLAKIGKK